MLIVLLLGLFLLLIRKKPDLRTGCLLVLIAFGSMIFINTIQAIPAILSSHEVNQEMMRGVPDDENPNVQVEQNVQFGANRPNVYYFLFDEYGGYDNLEHYYSFDNSAFLEDLEARGFSVSLHSHNTEAVATDTIVPNLLNMNYVVKVEESGHKKAQYRRSCLLYQMFAVQRLSDQPHQPRGLSGHRRLSRAHQQSDPPHHLGISHAQQPLQ